VTNPLLQELCDVDVPLLDAITTLNGSIEIVEAYAKDADIYNRLNCEAYVRDVRHAIHALEKLDIMRERYYDITLREIELQGLQV